MTERPKGLDDLLDYVADNMDTMEALRHLHAVLNDEDFSKLVFKGSTVRRLMARLDHFEAKMPSWLHGTPEDVDAWLRDLIPDDKRLAFYQWIGEQAINELIEESKKPSAKFDGEMVHVSGASREYADGWNDGVVSLPTDEKYPSALPVGRPFCDVPHHAHTDGGGRLPTCRLDSKE